MSFDTYEFEDGTKFRITSDRLLVRGDPLPKETSGGIIIPGKACEHVFRTGTIVAYGFKRNEKTGEKYPIHVEVGLKCCFVRFLAEQDSNKQFRANFGDGDIFFIGPTDLLFVWPSNEETPNINL